MKRNITEVYKQFLNVQRCKRKLIISNEIHKKKKIYYYDYDIIDMINFNKYYSYLFF